MCVCASLPTARSGGGDDAIGNNNNKKIMLLFSHPNFCGLYTSLRMKKKNTKSAVCLCRQSGNGSARGAIH